MIYLCCIRLFLLVTDFSSSKTEQLFSSRLSNFSVSSDIQYLRCYSHPQLKSNIYDEAVHHKYTKAPKAKVAIVVWSQFLKTWTVLSSGNVSTYIR